MGVEALLNGDMLRRRLTLLTAALLLTAANTGCSSDTVDVPVTGEVVSEFSLADMNATSSTFGDNVSPRDFLGRGSAWYFGHST